MVQDLGFLGTRRLVAEGGAEDDLGVFAGFEGEEVDAVGEGVEEVVLDDAAEEFEDGFGADFYFCGKRVSCLVLSKGEY